jgi:hypothetical protein
MKHCIHANWQLFKIMRLPLLPTVLLKRIKITPVILYYWFLASRYNYQVKVFKKKLSSILFLTFLFK